MASSKKPPAETDRAPAATLHQPASPRFPSGTPTAGANRKIAIAVDLSDESAFAVNWAVQNYLRPGDKDGVSANTGSDSDGSTKARKDVEGLHTVPEEEPVYHDASDKTTGMA
ncbi:universal stress protein PHOS34-like [Forsythia ovata]|uniref:Universal stress protein PHOS34-like n=1 Tax=Forsythia ovata TaxID=205694 RepID=A0ABD1QAY6_9LAMI